MKTGHNKRPCSGRQGGGKNEHEEIGQRYLKWCYFCNGISKHQVPNLIA